MPYTGPLRTLGLAKEVTLGTAVVPPTVTLNYVPPASFSPAIALALSKGIYAVPDRNVKAAQVKADLKGMKLKLEIEPANIGQVLQAAFGLDTPTEVASYVVVTGSNDTIDFVCAAGTEAATLAAGTYAAGLNSGTDASTTLCYKIAAAMHTADNAHTYTVTFSTSTKEFTIATNQATGTFSLLFHSGTNNAKTIAPLLGFITSADQTGAYTYTGSIATVPVFSHAFVRQAVNQLPTYTAYVDQGATYTAISGCMLDKLEVDVKAGELITFDAEWTGTAYQSESSQAMPAISTLQPLDASLAVIKLAGTTINDYDNFKLTIDNMVKADHVVNGSIYPGKIYSEGMEVKVSMDMYVESGNIAQWTTNYLTGVGQAVLLTITSLQLIKGSIYYSLVFTIKNLKYQTAPFANPQAVLKIPFAGVCLYDLGNSNETLDVALVNAASVAY